MGKGNREEGGEDCKKAYKREATTTTEKSEMLDYGHRLDWATWLSTTSTEKP